MKPHPVIPGALAFAAAVSFLVPAASGADSVTAVASRVSDDYVRAKLPDGSYQPEFYVFGEGGKWGGEISDATIDKLHFMDVARVIADALAGQNYVSAKDPNKTTLLVMVYWGTTQVPEPTSDSVAYDQFSAAQANLSSSVAAGSPGSRTAPSGGSDAALAQMTAALTMLNVVNRQRDMTDFKNVQMLGYDLEGVIGTEYGSYVRGTAFGVKRDDLVSEIEQNRYFVVLMAYDFQLMWKQKKHKLLWETRFSIDERHNAFDKALPVMALYASHYFGQPSHRLVRKQIPEGHVDIGDVKSLGALPEK